MKFVISIWAVVVAQLVEEVLPTPEIRSLNPFHSMENFIYYQLYWKDNNIVGTYFLLHCISLPLVRPPWSTIESE